MKNDKGELQLDLEPLGITKTDVREVLVPMHADNWALALASGYLGGSLKTDAATDVQSGLGNSVIGFHEAVPAWAITEGEAGPRVIIKLMHENCEALAKEGLVQIEGPIRVTTVTAVCFEDQSALENFQASYDVFPDVATGLADRCVEWPVINEVKRPEGITFSHMDGSFSRQNADFLGGFAAGLIDLLATGELDQPVAHFLSEPGQGIVENAKHLLLALEPSSPTLDVAIWTATMETLKSRFGKKGFDRRDFLTDVRTRIKDLGSEAASWLSGCQKVIDAEIDIPSLVDSEKIGRRAALAIILSHEPQGLHDLEHTLEAGKRVRALVSVAVYAFSGLSRIDEPMKSPVPRMNVVLATGEAILEGNPVSVEVQLKRIANDLKRHQVIVVAGNPVIEREIEPPPYLMMLKARIQEAGYKVEVEPETGQLGIRPSGAKGERIIVEDNRESTPEHPVVNLVLPITTLGMRPKIALFKALMAGAWEHATTVALRERGGKDEIVALASLPLATLDRDELNFHVERLLKVSVALVPAKGKRRRAKEN